MPPASHDAFSSAFQQYRWLSRDLPFPHIVAADVFTPAFYDELVHDFRGRMQRGEFEPMGSYDALGLSFDPTVLQSPFGFFFSRDWHDLIARHAGITSTGHMSGGLHHHVPGSASGRPHHDLNPGYFVEVDTTDGITIADNARCGYSTGIATDDQPEPRELIRGATVIFYLDNLPWQPGDGGATGLYRHRDDDIHQPAAIVPPHSNSLMIFPCTPWSFHGFISNVRNPRNCLVMWLHRDKDEVLAQWGAEPIVGWAR